MADVFTIAQNDDGSRLDLVLCKRYNMSRRFVRHCLKNGFVRYDGKILHRSCTVRYGTLVEFLYTPDTMTSSVQYMPYPLPVQHYPTKDYIQHIQEPVCILHQLHEGYICYKHPFTHTTVHSNVLIKPDSSAVPAYDGSTNISSVLYKLIEARNTNTATTLEKSLHDRGYYAILATRLDYATSGMVLVATDTLHYNTVRQLENDRCITKEYYAIIEGSCSACTIPYTLDTAKRKKTKVVKKEERNTLYHTTVTPLYTFPMAMLTQGMEYSTQNNLPTIQDTSDVVTLVRCTIYKGRRHQIRAHLSSIGTPLLGDTLYGGSALLPTFLLHTRKIHYCDTTYSAPFPHYWDFLYLLPKTVQQQLL